MAVLLGAKASESIYNFAHANLRLVRDSTCIAFNEFEISEFSIILCISEPQQLLLNLVEWIDRLVTSVAICHFLLQGGGQVTLLGLQVAKVVVQRHLSLI